MPIPELLHIAVFSQPELYQYSILVVLGPCPQIDRLAVGWDEADERIMELERELEATAGDNARMRVQVHEVDCQVG